MQQRIMDRAFAALLLLFTTVPVRHTSGLPDGYWTSRKGMPWANSGTRPRRGAALEKASGRARNSADVSIAAVGNDVYLVGGIYTSPTYPPSSPVSNLKRATLAYRAATDIWTTVAASPGPYSLQSIASIRPHPTEHGAPLVPPTR